MDTIYNDILINKQELFILSAMLTDLAYNKACNSIVILNEYSKQESVPNSKVIELQTKVSSLAYALRNIVKV